MESGRDKPDYREILTWEQPGRHGQWARWTPRTGHSRNFSPPNPRRPEKGGRFRRPGSLCHRIPRAVQGPRSPVGGGGAAAPQLPSPPRAPPAGPGPSSRWPPPPELVPEPATCPCWAAAASCAAASAGEWSALEFEQGPEPSQRHLRSRPPPPSSNSRSLRHSASHSPRAAARPRSQSRSRLLKPPRRRCAPHAPAPAIGLTAGPDGSCSPGPRGRVAQDQARERERERAAGLALLVSAATSSSRPRWETQVPRGWAAERVAQCRQLYQSLPLQGPAGVWGPRAVQLRWACGGRRPGARRQGARGPEPPSTWPGRSWPGVGDDGGTARRRTPEAASSVAPRFFAPLQSCSPPSNSVCPSPIESGPENIGW
nr:dapper homolog 3-like [Chlorocebus sabaeus]